MYKVLLEKKGHCTVFLLICGHSVFSLPNATEQYSVHNPFVRTDEHSLHCTDLHCTYLLYVMT